GPGNSSFELVPLLTRRFWPLRLKTRNGGPDDPLRLGFPRLGRRGFWLVRRGAEHQRPPIRAVHRSRIHPRTEDRTDRVSRKGKRIRVSAGFRSAPDGAAFLSDFRNSGYWRPYQLSSALSAAPLGLTRCRPAPKSGDAA